MPFTEMRGALGLGGRQVPGLLLVLEPGRAVRAIAKRLVGGVAAPAKSHSRPACKTVGPPLHIHKLNLAFNTQRAIIANCNLCGRHGDSLLRLIYSLTVRSCILQNRFQEHAPA